MAMMISQIFYSFVVCFLVIWNFMIQDSYGGAAGHPYMLWPDGKVYYKISDAFNSTHINFIESAFNAFHNSTCVKFVKRSNQTDYINFLIASGCASEVGRLGGKQDLWLGSCWNKTNLVIHQLMHTIGFYHEHNRWDRDDYVIFIFQNLQHEIMKDNFQSYSLDKLQNLQTPYDYESIMHYPSNAFAKHGKHTIVRKNLTATLVQAERLSPIDIQEINLLYNCTSLAPSRQLTLELQRPTDEICWGFRFRSDYSRFHAINTTDCINQCNESIPCEAIAFERGVNDFEDNCFFYGTLLNYTLLTDLNWRWGIWEKNKTSIICTHKKAKFQQIVLQHSPSVIDYKINVKTSNIYGAGTNANVFIQLIGTTGRLKKLALKSSLQNYNKFERNSIEQFIFPEVNLGELISINVWHDNSGFLAPWHLEYIEVFDNQLKYLFQFNRWFSTSHDDNKISRNLQTTKISYINNEFCLGFRLRGESIHDSHAYDSNECIRKCKSMIICEAISFNNDQFSRLNCFFFNTFSTNYTSQLDLNLQWGVWKKSPNFQCEYKSKIQWGLRFFRYYKSLYVEQPNICVKLCKVEITCDAITFNVANTYPDENCYFINIDDKDNNETGAPTQWGSWEKNTTWTQPTYSRNMINWDKRFTNHFEVLKAHNPVDCKLRCKVDLRCDAMSFHICKPPCLENCYFYNIIAGYETVYRAGELEWASWQKN